MTQKRNIRIDFLKYIAALCIIAIHTELFSEYSRGLNFLATEIIARLAVPYFAVCTGFFTSKAILNPDRGETITKVFRAHWKKLICMYAIWTGLYLIYSIPKWIEIGWFSAWAFADFFIAAIRIGSHYHLWYLLALIYALPLFYTCVRRVRPKLWIWISVPLYAVQVLCRSYESLIPNKYNVIYQLRDYSAIGSAVFLIFPLMLLGAMLSLRSNQEFKWTRLLLPLISVLYALEMILLHNGGQSSIPYVFMIYPTIATFFLWQIKKPAIKNAAILEKLGKGSSFIYCFHPMVVEVLEKLEVSPSLRFVLTAVICTCIWLVPLRLGRRKF